MAKQLKAGMYYMNIADMANVPGDVAHVYEHAFIESFYNYLDKNDVSSLLSGGLTGEVIGSAMFIEYFFYSDKAEKLFHKYAKSVKRIDKTLIDNSIKTVESEKYLPLEINHVEFNECIDILDQREMIHVDEMHEPLDLHEVSSKIKYSSQEPTDEQMGLSTEITIRFGAILNDLASNAAIIRLTPIINDAVMQELIKLGAYSRGMGYVRRNPRKSLVGFTLIVTVDKNIPQKQVKIAAKNGLNILKKAIAENPKMVQDYIDCFEYTPNWYAMPIDYYKSSGLLTSRKAIRNSFTIENIMKILSKIKINVSETLNDDYDEI